MTRSNIKKKENAPATQKDLEMWSRQIMHQFGKLKDRVGNLKENVGTLKVNVKQLKSSQELVLQIVKSFDAKLTPELLGLPKRFNEFDARVFKLEMSQKNR
ncbi:MAG: hypothetical protein WD200_00325 [Candidatus Andersenbacteria bacterium]